MSNNPEKYTLEGAEDEAEKMQEKVKSGKAEDYASAEKLVEREKEEGKIVDATKISTVFPDQKF